MADRPTDDPQGGEEPGFDWLYGTRRTGVGSSRDPEPTQMLPTFQRPDAAGPTADRPSAGGPYQSPAPPRTFEEPPSGRRSRHGFRPRIGWVRYVLLLWLVFLVAVPLIAWFRIDKVDATPDGDRPAEQPGTTYLVVGSDSREGLTRQQQLELGVGKGGGRRNDTILLLHTGSGPNLLMSIPRDSLVPVPGRGTTKINAAFAIGGPSLLVRTIEDSTGIRVDDYIEIGFAGFVDVVDAVGGVQICPTEAMKDKKAGLDVKKGCQDADGRVALGYARSRYANATGDIGRAQHQREVVSAVGAKAASPWTVLNPVRYARLASAGSSSVRVGEDTGFFSTLRFVRAMTRVNGDNGLTCGVPIVDLAVHWDEERSKRLFALVAEDRTGDLPEGLCSRSGLPGG